MAYLRYTLPRRAWERENIFGYRGCVWNCKGTRRFLTIRWIYLLFDAVVESLVDSLCNKTNELYQAATTKRKAWGIKYELNNVFGFRTSTPTYCLDFLWAYNPHYFNFIVIHTKVDSISTTDASFVALSNFIYLGKLLRVLTNFINANK